MIGPSPACYSCKRFVEKEKDSDLGWHCEAYPQGDINPDILVGGNPHTGPVEGDHGIRFEAK